MAEALEQTIEVRAGLGEDHSNGHSAPETVQTPAAEPMCVSCLVARIAFLTIVAAVTILVIVRLQQERKGAGK